MQSMGLSISLQKKHAILKAHYSPQAVAVLSVVLSVHVMAEKLMKIPHIASTPKDLLGTIWRPCKERMLMIIGIVQGVALD